MMIACRKMINLVTSVRDISDSLPALSGGVSGSVVENEPNLDVFTRDAPEIRQPRSKLRIGIRRQRYNPWAGGGPAVAFQNRYRGHGPMGHFGHQGYYSSSDSDSSYPHGPFVHVHDHYCDSDSSDL
jgi:hypothetical protein